MLRVTEFRKVDCRELILPKSKMLFEVTVKQSTGLGVSARSNSGLIFHSYPFKVKRISRVFQKPSDMDQSSASEESKCSMTAVLVTQTSFKNNQSGFVWHLICTIGCSSLQRCSRSSPEAHQREWQKPTIWFGNEPCLSFNGESPCRSVP